MFAFALACDLLWMPIQISDSLGEILDAQQSESTWASFTGAFGTGGYLRPLRIAQIKVLFDLAQGHYYWLVYRGLHAFLMVAALWLFIRVLRVSTRTDFAAAAFSLVVLIGLHTFRGTVQEAFPINHFLEIVVAALLTLNLARSRGGWLIDVAAALVFIAAALTLESGLLVWVVAVTAWATGWRGISTRGVAVMTACLAGYFYLRFGYFSTGVPSLSERNSGYLLTILDREDIQQRFGAQPLWFYTYNVVTSAASVLFSEPQAGVFVTIANWLNHRPMTRVLIPVATSVTTTVLIASVAIRALRMRRLEDPVRFIVVFAAVLAANAVLSFSYTKDDIVSIAGVFYALAAFGAVQMLLAASKEWKRQARVVCVACLCALAVGWTIRTVGVHVLLRTQAIKHQNDWTIFPYARQRSGDWPEDPGAQQLILQLRRQAIDLPLPNTRTDKPEWPSRLWLDD
jgi:hypothetical protein